MRGFRFFEEYTGSSRAQSAGNVIAVDLTSDVVLKDGSMCVRAICNDGEKTHPNSPVMATLLRGEFLGTHCRRISERRARDIHPKLFEYLDQLA